MLVLCLCIIFASGGFVIIKSVILRIKPPYTKHENKINLKYPITYPSQIVTGVCKIVCSNLEFPCVGVNINAFIRLTAFFF